MYALRVVVCEIDKIYIEYIHAVLYLNLSYTDKDKEVMEVMKKMKPIELEQLLVAAKKRESEYGRDSVCIA